VGIMRSENVNGRQVIDLYGFETKTIRFPSGYELRVKGRFAKVASKLWKYLITKGILVQSFGETEKITRIHIDGRDLFDKIYEHYFNLLEASRDPEEVLIGPNTLRQIMNTPALQDYQGGPFRLNAIGERCHAGARPGDMPRKEMFNLPVRVVPQMEGILVLDRVR
jgi:hypothetical protein